MLLINSSYGRAFKAIREDEIAAEAMGINLAKHKMLSFCISSFFAGVGGALFAMYTANAQAKPFTSTMTYEILLIVVIGGIGSVSGSCIATFLYVACSEWWLRFLDEPITLASGTQVPLLRNGFRMVVFSIVIMIVVLFFRRGIMGQKELPDLFRKRKKRRLRPRLRLREVPRNERKARKRSANAEHNDAVRRRRRRKQSLVRGKPRRDSSAHRPHGAGKTTAFNCITGVYQPTNGEISFEETPSWRKKSPST